MAEELAADVNADRIALAIAWALRSAELSTPQDTLSRTRDRAVEILTTMHLPQLPDREQLAARAKAMFVRTKSMDDIIDRAYNYLLRRSASTWQPREAARPMAPRNGA